MRWLFRLCLETLNSECLNKDQRECQLLETMSAVTTPWVTAGTKCLRTPWSASSAQGWYWEGHWLCFTLLHDPWRGEARALPLFPGKGSGEGEPVRRGQGHWDLRNCYLITACTHVFLGKTPPTCKVSVMGSAHREPRAGDGSVWQVPLPCGAAPLDTRSGTPIPQRHPRRLNPAPWL